MSLRLHHLAIATSDPERLAAFYTGVLGLERDVTHRHPDGRVRSVWVKLEPGVLMIEETAEPAAAPRAFASKAPGLHLLALAIAPAERDQLLSKLRAQGVAIEHETAFTFYFRDPDGNRLGFSHYPAERA
ncbi:MAG: VOC family protein [Deltaproteobacteria bacterium]|nr:VOC family protein [Deltaproteobacteria bacterium]